MTEKELKKIKVEIFSRFKLNDTIIKNTPLQNYELELIYKQFKQYKKEDILKAIEIKFSNPKEFASINKYLQLKEIKNYFLKHKELNNKTYIYLTNLLDISQRQIEERIRQLKKENFFEKEGIVVSFKR